MLPSNNQTHKILLLLANILLFSLLIKGQTYPISTATTVLAPYPTTLDGFVSEEANKVNLQLIVNDITLSAYPVKLRMVLSNNTNTISTHPNYKPAPVYLEGGEIQNMDALDLHEYFQVNNLLFEGISKNQYQQMGQLPEGIYQLYFEVRDYYRDIVISKSIANAMVWVFLNEPPRLNLPTDANEISIDGPQNILFSWSTHHSPFAHPGFSPEYKFQLWEIYPENRNAYQVVSSSLPVYEISTEQTSTFYTLNEPSLIPGRIYAWRVQASDPEGIAQFKEKGLSEVNTFTYGRKCDAPEIDKITASTNSITLNWDSPQLSDEYIIQYKQENSQSANWYKASTRENGISIEPLKDNTTYIVEVQAKCANQTSPFSMQETISTPQNIDYACGSGNQLSIPENKESLPYLLKGDIIRAGDFSAEILEVEGSNGSFSGKASVLVPYMGFIKIIAEFTGIQVNTDYELISGELKTMYDLSNSLAANIGGMSYIFNRNETGIETETNNFTDSSKVETINGGINTISVSNNTITIVGEDGTKEVITANSDEKVVVTNDQGVDYLVDTETQTVYTQGSSGAPSGGSGSLQKPSSISKMDFKVDFTPATPSLFGYDAKNAQRPEGNYNTIQLGGSSQHVAWKSTRAGSIDKLQATISGSPTDSVFFSRQSANMVMTAPGSDAQNKQIMITGLGHEETDELLAWYRHAPQDTSKAKENTLAGMLNLVSYDEQLKEVCLVAVNESQIPLASYVHEELNRIYAPAVVKFTVNELQGGLNVALSGDDPKTIDNTDKDNRMDYTPDMREVIKSLKDHPLYDKSTVYLFFFDGAVNENLKGYMPLKGQYGFIYKFKQDPVSYMHTIAHELGHGFFRLRHTFSSENKFFQAQGSSDNLMDYTSTSAENLYKYQWDLVHNPENMLFTWLEDEDEGALVAHNMTYDENANIGGMVDFVSYIISDKLIFDIFKEKIIESGTIDINTLNAGVATAILMSTLDNDVQIDVPEEALVIVSMVYQCWMLSETLDMQTEFIEFIENAEYEITKELIIQDFLAKRALQLTYSSQIAKYLQDYHYAYFNGKVLAMQGQTSNELSTRVLTIRSNTKLKNILRDVMGVQDGEQMKSLMANSGLREKYIKDFFTDNADNIGLYKNPLSRQLSMTDIEPDVIKQQSYISKSLKNNKAFDIIIKNSHVFDAGFFFLEMYRGESTISGTASQLGTALIAKELSLTMGATIGPLVSGFALSALALVFEHYISSLAEELELEPCEYPFWIDIRDWSDSKDYSAKYGDTPLLLQYTEKQESYNSTIPTSIRILDINLAKKVFGFEPKFVNYDFPQEDSFIPKCFVPYE